jgi:hypothetical protein
MESYICLVFGVHRSCLGVYVVTADEAEVRGAAEGLATASPGAVGYEVWLHGRKMISRFDKFLRDNDGDRFMNPSSACAVLARPPIE